MDGTRLLLLTNRFPLRVVSYDVATDTWHAFPAPPVELRGNDMLAAGGGYAYVADQDDTAANPDEGRIERLDLRSGTWSQLPASPHRPRLSVRAMTVTRRGLLVDGLYGLDPDDRQYQAEVERFADGQWHRFPTPDGLRAAGYDFAWTGSRLAAPFTSESHGASLDPGSGRWQRFDPQPDPGAVGWQVSRTSQGAPGYVVRGGLAFDLATGRSRVITRPGGADSEAEGALVGGFLYVVDARSVLWRTEL
ncbi:MAG: hypothetical protein QM747_03680 [Nocardioides sp.]